MPGQVWSHGGDEWEDRILVLLKRKYGPNFVEIPDEDKGDYGLEGFSRDGYAYQCYAAENPLTPKILYKRQRDKITTDINKFVENKDGLLAILGPTKISHWILVVPFWSTKELLKHAENKAEEIRELCLPHVKEDFFITVEIEDYFAVELAQIYGSRLPKLLIEPEAPFKDTCENYIDCNNELINNLERKIKLMFPFRSFELKEKLKINFINRYINGQNVLDKLNFTYPELYSKATKIKDNREDFLEIESMLSISKPSDFLYTTIDKYTNELSEELQGLDSHTIEILTYEAISDWLLRCPLDFPDEVCI